jgi:hypothetical protein
MLHRLRVLAPLVIAAALTSGCYAGPRRGVVIVDSHHHHGHSDGADLAFAAIGLVAAAAVIASTEPEPRQPEPLYYQPVVYTSPPPSLPPSPKDRVDNQQPQSFDAKSARAALGAVDLASCRAEGAPRGYGHAKVTFNPDGKASKVVVDTPDGLSPSAVKCIGDRLGAVTVPEYEGSFITVGTTWFVP